MATLVREYIEHGDLLNEPDFPRQPRRGGIFDRFQVAELAKKHGIERRKADVIKDAVQLVLSGAGYADEVAISHLIRAGYDEDRAYDLVLKIRKEAGL
ncbi:hypothetical protein PsAD2_04448 [Pseudovibrio axinellae]|uniref:Uncharacterized protein n=1 Tax=Pseudovibrio axinellae TaxID=989403 RepID=A0A161X7U5_9HYPH|nr:hypothetical protein [Pseudovibrio axinellae]KZL05093.1 hypothetical protein PsAD2_04448 [Pseudovibrio axinellae]SER48042.1 hypothetical protein SAMN05421798_1119 [Pseudovibrio axinellae]